MFLYWSDDLSVMFGCFSKKDVGSIGQKLELNKLFFWYILHSNNFLLLDIFLYIYCVQTYFLDISNAYSCFSICLTTETNVKDESFSKLGLKNKTLFCFCYFKLYKWTNCLGFSGNSHSKLNFMYSCLFKGWHFIFLTIFSAVQHKMSEENIARMRAESRVLEVEKQCSMLEFDLKQSVQKMEQLMKQKERLEDEVSKRLVQQEWLRSAGAFSSPARFPPSSGQESENPAGSGVQQAGHRSDRPEEPLAGSGPAEMFREAAQAGDQHGAGEQTLAGVPTGPAD